MKPGTFKMEIFVKIINDWKPLKMVTKSSILDVKKLLFKASVRYFLSNFYFLIKW